MAQGPWEKYGQSAPATGGDPVVRQADPFKASAEQRAVNAEARAAQDQAWQAQKTALDIQKAQLDIEKTRENTAAVQANEGERKAAAFLIRALGSNESYEATGIGPRSLVGQAVADAAPNVLNSLPGFIGNSAERQVADTTQDEFIAASLRQDSGAAIPPEEMERQRRIYFPMPGDGPEAIEAKRQARIRAIEGLRQSAGRLEEGAEQRYQAMIGGQQAEDRDDEGFTAAERAAGLTGSVTDESPNDPTPDDLQRIIDIEGEPGIGTLAKHGITLGLSDEAAGIGGAIAGWLQGKDPVTEYERSNRLQDQMIERARRNNPVIGTAAEVVGGGGAARFAGNALLSIPQAIRQGAGIGALGGFGYGEGSTGSALGALAGGAMGGALGGGIQAGVNALTGRATSRAAAAIQPDMEVVAAGQRQNIPIRQPDAFPHLRGDLATSEASTYAGGRVAGTLADDRAAVQQRLTDIGGAGNVQAEAYNLGQQVQGVGTRYIARTKQQANRLYRRAEELANGQAVQPTQAIQAIDDHIAELRSAGENANRGQISYLEGLRNDLAKPGGLTIGNVQNLRTNMRGQLSERNLTATDAERRVASVIAAANDDLARELPEGAAGALAAADKFYAERQDFINKVISQFNGARGKPLPPEQAATRLTAMVRNKADFDRMQRFMKEATPEEAADFTATIAEGLGRGRNGEFGLGALATNVEKMPPNIRRLMFGEDGAKALEDLRVIARAKSDTAGGLNNSRSGVVVARQIGLRALLSGTLGAGATGGSLTATIGAPLATEVMTAIGQRRAARLLLNPDFTKWLRNAPNTTNPAVINRYFEKLAGMSSVAANDNAAFTAAIRSAFSSSPTSRVMAGEENNDVRREPISR